MTDFEGHLKLEPKRKDQMCLKAAVNERMICARKKSGEKRNCSSVLTQKRGSKNSPVERPERSVLWRSCATEALHDGSAETVVELIG